MGFALLYENFADQAVLAGGDWPLGLANLQDPDIGLPARSSSAQAVASQFSVNLGSSRPVGGIVLGPINTSPGASYRIRSYADAALMEPLYDSGTIILTGNVVDWSDPSDWLEWEDPNFWLGITPNDLGELPFFIIHTIPVASASLATAQFWTVEIADPNNPDGVVSIGRLYMGRIYRPSANYAYEGNDFGIQPLTDVTESLGGSETFWERGLRREFRVSWPMLPESEVFDAWVRIMLRARTSRQVFIIPEESDEAAMLQKRAFLARFKATPRIAQVLFERASTSIDAQEIL